MPVTLSRNVATLTGIVSVDDAEPLAQWLRVTRRPHVKLAGCSHLHTAALQALLATRPAVLSPPAEPFLARWIAPLLVPLPVPADDEEIR